ncbi:BTB/POZ domain-containing protein [Xylariaceae sp. FL1651]|nr:BTB/POZ domain-containing protein [Xylariaceae sp. FL1651]
MTESKRSFVEGIGKLFNNPDHEDMKIYTVYQIRFFRKALSENFREAVPFQRRKCTCSLEVFEYLYTGKYAEEPVPVLDTQDDNELVKGVRVHVTAEFFMLDDPKHLALQQFKSKLNKLWLVYASTTESENELRSAVVEVAYTHRDKLWYRKAF